eukprot:276957-Chlamydomonas_euryale.AAC.2
MWRCQGRACAVSVEPQRVPGVAARTLSPVPSSCACASSMPIRASCVICVIAVSDGFHDIIGRVGPGAHATGSGHAHVAGSLEARIGGMQHGNILSVNA